MIRKIHITLEIDTESNDLELFRKGFDQEDYDREMFQSCPGYAGIGDGVVIYGGHPDGGVLDLLDGVVTSIRLGKPA